MKLLAIVVVVLLCYQSQAADDVTTTELNNEQTQNKNISKPHMYYFHVDSKVKYRYANTLISTRIANPANVAQEVSFSAVLPETAFISGFLMEVDGKVYDAYVKEKEEAKQVYDAAVQQGQTAAHVELTARDSNRFTVSVNVEPQKKVTFNLTYEELLGRKLGTYKQVINLDPGQIVQDFRVKVHIEESSKITTLNVPALKVSNEIKDKTENDTTNPLAVIERPTPESAVITYAPTAEQQKELAEEGLKGQFIVEYDVDRTSQPGEVLVNDGYFVHFFSPSDLKPLPKQVTFVLDVSGSMGGRKIEQLRQAMTTILGDLNKDDFFSIVLFSQTAQVWDPTLNETELEKRMRDLDAYFPNPNDYHSGELVPSVIVKADEEGIAKAKKFVEKLQALGSTAIYDGLMMALNISKLESEQPLKDNEKAPEPIIIFLTDGQPNVRVFDPEIIVKDVTKENTKNSSIFSLALGDDADFKFLKKLSLLNTGFARKIYEASDTAIQLRDFYREIASPLVANVTFKYEPNQVDEDTVTKQSFRRFFSGSEIVVAGKVLQDKFTGKVEGNVASGIKHFMFEPIIDIDIIPEPPGPKVNHTPSAMERMWAYLTIQQLLEEDQAKDYDHNDKNQTSPEKKRALELALKYSFVTPLTSLVVVKPNETKPVDPEDASRNRPDLGGGYGGAFFAGAGAPVPAAYPGSAAAFGGGGKYPPPPPPPPRFGSSPSGTRGNYPPPPPPPPPFWPTGTSSFIPMPANPNIPAAPSYGSFVPVPANPNYPAPPSYGSSGKYPSTPHQTFWHSTTARFPVMAETDIVVPESLETTSEDMTTQAIPVPARLVTIKDITWLSSVSNNDTIVLPTGINGTDEVLRLAGANETNAVHSPCKTPTGEAGYCRHLKFCVLDTFIVNKEDFLPYVCHIDSFLGTCCPYYITPASS